MARYPYHLRKKVSALGVLSINNIIVCSLLYLVLFHVGVTPLYILGILLIYILFIKHIEHLLPKHFLKEIKSNRVFYWSYSIRRLDD